jgi:hypothetical protein
LWGPYINTQRFQHKDFPVVPNLAVDGGVAVTLNHTDDSDVVIAVKPGIVVGREQV